MTLATCTQAYACIMPKEGYLYMPVSMALAMCTMGRHDLGNVHTGLLWACQHARYIASPHTLAKLAGAFLPNFVPKFILRF